MLPAIFSVAHLAEIARRSLTKLCNLGSLEQRAQSTPSCHVMCGRGYVRGKQNWSLAVLFFISELPSKFTADIPIWPPTIGRFVFTITMTWTGPDSTQYEQKYRNYCTPSVFENAISDVLSDKI
eukprot:3261202-Amphidinium_carterae.1